MANILKGSGRERYDYFLSNGFPKWRGTGYYYARLRPGLGSVLVGLFVLGGGAAHYGAMYLSWKRQRDFVGRYIRHARRAAWGDEMGIQGIPGVDTSPSGSSPPHQSNDAGGAMVMNRRQKRYQEKESKKDKDTKKVKATRGTRANGLAEASVPAQSQGERKRVIAENGKVLIVDSTGNVYLEEESEDGEKGEYLLDVDEIPRPTIRQTVLVRLPVWLFDISVGRFLNLSQTPSTEDDPDEAESGIEDSDQAIAKARPSSNGKVRSRSKRNGKAQ